MGNFGQNPFGTTPWGQTNVPTPPGSILAGQLLYRSFRECGQLRPGWQPSPELLVDGLAEFQYMFDGWNSVRTMTYTVPDYIYPVTGPGSAPIESGQVLGMGYYIGPNAPDFNGPRPTAILRANLIYSVTASAPTRIPLAPLSAEEWANISVLQLTPINVTTVYYYEPKVPWGILWVWPPLNGNSIELFTWGFLTPPTALTSFLQFPPGYQDLIIYTLAARLWPLCTKDILIHKKPLNEIRADAYRAQQRVQQLNAPMPRLRNDFNPGRTNTPSCDWTLLLAGIPY